MNEGSWEWIARANNWQPYTKPVIVPGAGAESTSSPCPSADHEWVSAVEFEAFGRVYRQEFDLGPTGTAYGYRGFCSMIPQDTSCSH